MSDTNDRFGDGFWAGVGFTFIALVLFGLLFFTYTMTYDKGYKAAIQKVSEQQLQQKKESK